MNDINTGLEGISKEQIVPSALRQDYPHQKLRLNPGACCHQKSPSNLQGSCIWYTSKGDHDFPCLLSSRSQEGQEECPSLPAARWVGLYFSQEQKYVGERRKNAVS